MADLTIKDAGVVGALAAAGFESAASGGDQFDNEGERVVVLIKNDSSGDRTVTATTQRDSNYGDQPDESVTVAAGDIGVMGPFATARYSDPVKLSYDNAGSLQVAAVKIPQAGTAV